MATEESSKTTDLETKVESAMDSKPNQEAESKVVDDPGKSIQKILGIVESLHKIFPSQPDEEQLRKSRSMGPTSVATETSTPPVTNGQPVALASTTSLPTMKPEESENTIPKLQRNLRLLKEDVFKLQDLNEEVGEEVQRYIRPLQKLLKKVEADSSKTKTKLTKGNKKDLEDINKKIFNLMCQVPLLPNKRGNRKGLDSDAGDGDNNGKGIECLPGIHAKEKDLKSLAVFKDVQGKLKQLTSDERRICLLSFAVFPENQEVNRTMLMYWWIGEGILAKAGAEDEVKEILKEFTDQNLIEPVENKRKVEPNSYKMTPFVHSSVVLISKEIELFDMYHKGEKPTMKLSALNKVCLVDGSSSQQEAKAKKMPAKDIETVFNVSERFPDFAFKWFSEDQSSKNNKFSRLSKPTYKNLMVFYLGRWERTAKRHIEVENPELMKYLKYMTKLKLLSFQGISRIERLDDAVCKLRELIILDLRACYNLEKLPEKIDSLKALIYLDITDCYMIDRMPKRLSWLDNLEVLKGFVVSDATDEETVCTLAELVHLKKLRKLSITINKGDFSVEDLFTAIKDFKSLEKLKVAWGGINERQDKVIDAGKDAKKDKAKEAKKDKAKEAKEDKATGATDKKEHARGILQRTVTRIFGEEKDRGEPKLPTTLKKLDLQCFPNAELPKWLKPQNLGGVEKLYIKGGTELTGFGELQTKEPTECNVKVLRLKFLPRLKVEWRDLRELYFPKLEFLDKYQCPQVSFCPCDGIGIWREKV